MQRYTLNLDNILSTHIPLARLGAQARPLTYGAGFIIPTGKPAFPGMHHLLRRCVQHGGAAGCCIRKGNETVDCPGYPVKVYGTSGAGDSFAAAFIHGFLNGWPLPEIGAFANVIGAAKVQNFGAGRNVPTKSEILALIAAYKVKLPHLQY